MAFVSEQSKIPTSIGSIVVTLMDAIASDSVPNGTTPAYQSAQFRVAILDQDGNQMRNLSCNLEPHLTPAQRTALTAFMDDLRAKAESEILPPAE